MFQGGNKIASMSIKWPYVITHIPRSTTKISKCMKKKILKFTKSKLFLFLCGCYPGFVSWYCVVEDKTNKIVS